MQWHYAITRNLINRGIHGDIVECGVFNGGSAATLALLWKQTAGQIWLYDSFAGMPEPSALDQEEAYKAIGACIGSEDNVHQAMTISGIARNQYLIRKGQFEDTFLLPLPTQIALLHIDSDWYQNVLLCLDTFYDLVVEDGVVLLDDYGHWEGARAAFYDFVERRRLRPLVERFGHAQLFWIKGRGHNRDFIGKESVL
jgi:O-methyltransferase